MNQSFRDMDGNTDYRTFCLYLFVRRGIPISMSVYNFVGDVVKSETLQKYFEGRDLTFSEKRMEDCADYIMAHYNEWLKNSEEWYDKYGGMDRYDRVLEALQGYGKPVI